VASDASLLGRRPLQATVQSRKIVVAQIQRDRRFGGSSLQNTVEGIRRAAHEVSGKIRIAYFVRGSSALTFSIE
jgi:hypothetical protein